LGARGDRGHDRDRKALGGEAILGEVERLAVKRKKGLQRGTAGGEKAKRANRIGGRSD